MLTRCPYEFDEIDLDNLAYELVFPKRWDWERVTEQTVINGFDKKYFDSDDNVRFDDRFFRNNAYTDNVFMLLEGEGRRENGLKALCKYIEEQNKKEEQTLKKIRYCSKDRWDTFEDSRNHIMMYAIPCCPNCHNRLPIGWRQADDFAAISLMGPTSSGKTTWLYSMMHGDWQAFKDLNNKQLGELNITGAYFRDKADWIYNFMMREANNMCQTNGECPDNTNKEFWIPPIFLRIEYKGIENGELEEQGHVLILGIYDNAGENLTEMDLIENPNLHMLLDDICAEMFIFDPNLLNLALPKPEQESKENVLKDCKVLPLDEQAKMQKEKKDEIIRAKTLLQLETETRNDYDEAELMKVFGAHQDTMGAYGDINRFREEIDFYGVIVKSDLLKNLREVQSHRWYHALFENGTKADLVDWDSLEENNRLVQKMIKDLRLFGDKDIDDFKKVFGEINPDGTPGRRQSVSWHCISALGCDTKDGKLNGKYAPINVAQPLVRCIIQLLRKNEWIR